MSLHTLFGKHVPDPRTSHWDRGLFVTTCTLCGCDMFRLPGLPWRLHAGKQA